MRLMYFSLILMLVSIDASCGKFIERNIRDVSETYSTRYDNIDVDAILASARLLKNYVNCLLNDKPCTPEGELLKKYLSDALATECSKCSRKQKEIAGKVLGHLLQYHKDYWNQLLEKFDKDGSYRRKHEGFREGESTDYSDLDEARR